MDLSLVQELLAADAEQRDPASEAQDRCLGYSFVLKTEYALRFRFPEEGTYGCTTPDHTASPSQA